MNFPLLPALDFLVQKIKEQEIQKKIPVIIYSGLCSYLISTSEHFLFRFIKAGMNIIDLLGVLPYFLSLGLSIANRGAR